ncbi:MAG: 16S rRNA (guanine(527)-N(7))-methyltransferase RsmG [Anaerolineae bacterium]|nr:16S rRNA (guanine(527)-N(7))-methyltransferase RsmG [Anaerolineae bacterium]MDW8102685.1 16S rRNA (guanine(527)-N(7))-methyltransferase RsmG [Anaerolineae bacterium]
MNLLILGARRLGLELDPEKLRAFEVYYHELRKWNRKANLTSLIAPNEVQVKHFLDSLTIYEIPEFREAVSSGRKINFVDVGTGGGFPGIPIKIVTPGINLVLVDSSRKKIQFLEHLKEALGLEGVEIIWGRAEEIARQENHRERYDWVVARALAEFPTLAEYLLPFCRIGGYVVAYKGPKIFQELEISLEAINLLGGKVVRLHSVQTQGLESSRYLLLIAKESSTPLLYPRRPGIPAKRPLKVSKEKGPVAGGASGLSVIDSIKIDGEEWA